MTPRRSIKDWRFGLQEVSHKCGSNTNWWHFLPPDDKVIHWMDLFKAHFKFHRKKFTGSERETFLLCWILWSILKYPPWCWWWIIVSTCLSPLSFGGFTIYSAVQDKISLCVFLNYSIYHTIHRHVFEQRISTVFGSWHLPLPPLFFGPILGLLLGFQHDYPKVSLHQK